MTQEVTVRLNGDDDYWKLILDADLDGVWTVDEIAAESAVDRSTIKAFVQRLVKGGYARECGMPLGYILLKRPANKPRLKADGREYAETKLETLWRSMRMAKTFTAASLVSFGSINQRQISLETARRYLTDLASAGIIAPLRDRDRSYRLVRDLGARAPRILTAHIVFDPNSRLVIGEPVAREARP